eukprot:TRINITY_DN64443_c1_g1_i1.p1 TRINITY_DN64443_c1_g1~~TRINITY_DN64443_c1_g1_i1.p1  ORF type:complete len:143 (+),score=5.81 TRINITY_DN64443_c1_g1_i1:21-449(+)
MLARLFVLLAVAVSFCWTANLCDVHGIWKGTYHYTIRSGSCVLQQCSYTANTMIKVANITKDGSRLMLFSGLTNGVSGISGQTCQDSNRTLTGTCNGGKLNFPSGRENPDTGRVHHDILKVSGVDYNRYSEQYCLSTKAGAC